MFGLLSAISWGSADFGGGLASRRAPLLAVVAGTQVAGLAGSIVLVLVRGEAVPSGPDVAWSIAAGVSGGVGITTLYHALSTGPMAVVAPVSGVLAAATPVLVGFVLQGLPGPGVMAGIVLALVAVLLVSRSPAPAHVPIDELRRAMRSAVAAGLGLGGFAILISPVTEGGIFGPVAIVRATEALLVCGLALATRRPWRPPASVLPLVGLSGVLDAGGNVFFVAAEQAGRLDVAAVLSSLYPVATILLATLLLRERVTGAHALGIAAAIGAIALIGAGSTG